MTNKEELKSIVDWAKEDGLIILDPDGFDRSDPQVMSKLRSREEYEKGIMLCMIDRIKKFNDQ
jgi:hypothetical protein